MRSIEVTLSLDSNGSRLLVSVPLSPILLSFPCFGQDASKPQKEDDTKPHEVTLMSEVGLMVIGLVIRAAGCPLCGPPYRQRKGRRRRSRSQETR